MPSYTHGYYHCPACMVGGCEQICWLCGELMILGNVTTLNRTRIDWSMDSARTHFAPEVVEDYKTMDDLIWPTRKIA